MILFSSLAASAGRLRVRLGTTMATRPRLAFGALLAFVTLSVLAAPTTSAAPKPKDECDGWSCGVVEKIPGYDTAKGIWDTARETTETIQGVSSGSFLDDWAKGMAEAVVFLLAFIESTAQKLMAPAYDQPWWRTQYAVSFGLALIVLAFMMVFVTARIGSSDGSVSGVELLRQSGWRMIFVVPAIAIAPGFMYAVQQLAAALTKSFATESMKEGHGAVGELMKKLDDAAGDWGAFGGVFLVIVMMLFIILAAVILLVEIAVSQWGLMLTGLLVPFGLVASVYPPWARVLKGLSVLIASLMFMPVFIFFFFWTVWSAFQNALGGDHAENSGFSLLLFLLISFLMIDAFPLVAMWLMKMVAPGGVAQMDDDVRGVIPAPTEGSVFTEHRDREKSVERGGSGGGANDGDTAPADGGGSGGSAADDPMSAGGKDESGFAADGAQADGGVGSQGTEGGGGGGGQAAIAAEYADDAEHVGGGAPAWVATGGGMSSNMIMAKNGAESAQGQAGSSTDRTVSSNDGQTTGHYDSWTAGEGEAPAQAPDKNEGTTSD